MAPLDGVFHQPPFWHLDAVRGPSTPSFDDLVGAGEQRIRHGQAECPGGLQIDDKLEFDGGLNGKVARLFALQDAIRIGRRAPKIIGPILSVGQQPTKFSEKTLS
jgi:hypothetical protein